MGGQDCDRNASVALCGCYGAMTPLTPFFASDSEVEIERLRPEVWLFGHTHRPAELLMAGITLLRNVPVGYESELRDVDLDARVRS